MFLIRVFLAFQALNWLVPFFATFLVHGVYMHGGRELYFKMLYVRQSFFLQKNCHVLYFQIQYEKKKKKWQSVFLLKYYRVLYCGMLYARKLFFSKNTTVFGILECYMHGSPSFAESTAVH